MKKFKDVHFTTEQIYNPKISQTHVQSCMDQPTPLFTHKGKKRSLRRMKGTRINEVYIAQGSMSSVCLC